MREKKINKTPARLDFIQSMTGAILGLFIMGHIIFESSILISHEMMYKVTLMFEGYYFFGEKYPSIISFLAGAIFTIFILHSLIALSKFPSKYKEYRVMKNHLKSMRHEDSFLWMIQVMTGFAMFFLGSIHLYFMIVHPGDIGPYASSVRVAEEYMWILYAALLFSVVSHAFIGLYRLAMKWGFMEGKDSKKSRRIFKFFMKLLILVYLVLGSLSLWRYFEIGTTHDFEIGERYHSKTLDIGDHK